LGRSGHLKEESSRSSSLSMPHVDFIWGGEGKASSSQSLEEPTTPPQRSTLPWREARRLCVRPGVWEATPTKSARSTTRAHPRRHRSAQRPAVALHRAATSAFIHELIVVSAASCVGFASLALWPSAPL
jgi:hypothetical protein